MNARGAASLAIALALFPGAASAERAPTAAVPQMAAASAAIAAVARWVVETHDNRGLPFAVVDKVAAEVAVFDAQGRDQGVQPALLGLAHGDDSTPGIGERPLSTIGPGERTTPAGRFAAFLAPAAGMREVLWIDYEASVSLHPVITTNPAERRLERLKSPSPEDNRITFGCINVSQEFYSGVVRKAFAVAGGVVYILPESKAPEALWRTFGAAEEARQGDPRNEQHSTHRGP